ncbi:MAG: IS110 family transposase, partial [Pseudomonadota bacterium]
YNKLRSDPTAPKPPKVALIAIARKIIVIANAILRDKKAYA